MAKKTTMIAERVAPPERLKSALRLRDLMNNDQMKSALSAHERAAKQVRDSLQLPNLDALSKQMTATAAVPSKNIAGRPSALDLARAAASTMPALIERENVALSPLEGQLAASAPLTAISSAHDLGQLIRKERENGRLSQQAFADLVGVGRRFISELENGKATLEFDKVLQVAAAVGIDVLARRRR